MAQILCFRCPCGNQSGKDHDGGSIDENSGQISGPNCFNLHGEEDYLPGIGKIGKPFYPGPDRRRGAGRRQGGHASSQHTSDDHCRPCHLSNRGCDHHEQSALYGTGIDPPAQRFGCHCPGHAGSAASPGAQNQERNKDQENHYLPHQRLPSLSQEAAFSLC